MLGVAPSRSSLWLGYLRRLILAELLGISETTASKGLSTHGWRLEPLLQWHRQLTMITAATNAR